MKRLLIACFVLMMAIPAQADPGKNESGHKRGYIKVKNQKKHKYKKKKGLPPGWRKQIARGKRLDDDIYYQLQPVPRDVFVVLPPPPPGAVYKMIEGQILKIDEANRTILKVLEKSGIPLPPIPKLPGLR